MLKILGINFNSKGKISNSKSTNSNCPIMTHSQPMTDTISFKANAQQKTAKIISLSGHKFIETAAEGIFKSEKSYSAEVAKKLVQQINERRKALNLESAAFSPENFRSYLDDVIKKFPEQLNAEAVNLKPNEDEYFISLEKIKQPNILKAHYNEDDRIGFAMKNHIINTFKYDRTPHIHQSNDGNLYVVSKADDYSAGFARFEGIKIALAKKID